MSNESLIVAQIIGLIAAVVNIGAVQLKVRKHILLGTIIAGIFWVTHYSLLGAWTGAAMNGLGIVMVAVFYLYNNPKKRSIWVLILMMILLVAAGMATWQSLVSILPIVGMLLAALSFWQVNEQKIRLYLILTSTCWLFYNVLIFSYIGFGKEVLTIVSLGLALWRYHNPIAHVGSNEE